MKPHGAIAVAICLVLFIFQGCVDYAPLDLDGGNACTPDCKDKCCGDDGCGGTCPDKCMNGFCCDYDSCKCITDCDWGCDVDSDCMEDKCCINNWCEEMSCGTLQCGPDPVCGKECGPCVAPQVCSGGQCVTESYGALGDPCTFGDVNITAGDCSAGLECLGIPADGNAGTCPGGSHPECAALPIEWNIDCVNGNCGASFCSEPCDGHGNCPAGFVGQDVGSPVTCMCIPVPTGAGQPGDPCPWGNVNTVYDDCHAGMACLGNDDIGSCPGGTDAECTGVADRWNTDCVNGVCGFSFCSDECDAQGRCPHGFVPMDVSGICFCIPLDECDASGNCPSGFMPYDLDGTCYCMPA